MGIRMFLHRTAGPACVLASERQTGGTAGVTRAKIMRVAHLQAREVRRRVTVWAPADPRSGNARRPWTSLRHTRLARLLRRLAPTKSPLSGKRAASAPYEPFPGRRGPDATP